MSRQYPTDTDIDYLIDWAERKIIQIARSDRSKNFSTTADFTRSITIFLDTMEMYSDPSESWLRRRISDTYYAMSGMRLYEEGSEKFTEFENWVSTSGQTHSMWNCGQQLSGINKIAQEKKLDIFPNPSNGKNIVLKSSVLIKNIAVILILIAVWIVILIDTIEIIVVKHIFLIQK